MALNCKFSGLREKLEEAYHQRDFPTVKKIFNGGFSVNTVLSRSETLLYKTVCGNNRALAKWLLWKGADVNKPDKNRTTPLLRAFSTGKGIPKFVNLLIHFGADINLADSDQQTPLHFACWGESTKIVERLIAKGAKINVVDDFGFSPLVVACEHGNIDLIQVLIKNGANVNLVNAKGETPLFYACNSYHEEPIDILMSYGALVNVQDLKGNSPLHWGAEINAEVVEALLVYGADINCRNKEGRTPYDVCLKYIESRVYMNPVEKQELKSTFLKHIIKLYVAKLPIDVDISSEVGSDLYQEMLIKSTEEFSKIRTVEIIKGYSVLGIFKNINKPYLLDEENFQKLENVMHSYNLYRKLPNYSYIICNIFVKSKLLTQAYLSLQSERRQDWCRNLPSLVVGQILLYLSLDDLKNLVISDQECC